jgi:hypothetical protein
MGRNVLAYLEPLCHEVTSQPKCLQNIMLSAHAFRTFCLPALAWRVAQSLQQIPSSVTAPLDHILKDCILEHCCKLCAANQKCRHMLGPLVPPPLPPCVIIQSLQQCMSSPAHS